MGKGCRLVATGGSCINSDCINSDCRWTAKPERAWQVDRAAKKELVAELNSVFKGTSVVVVAHYSGLTVSQMQNLRRQMKQAGAAVKVAKNRLAKIAVADTEAAVIGPLLK